MVNWNSPAVLEACSIATDKINMYILGLYSYYLLATIWKVEIALITRRLSWHWSYLYYLGARYCSLASQLTSVIPISYVTNRGALVVVVAGGSLTTVCATGNLLLRTAAIWRGNRIVLAVLTLTGGGHIVMFFIATLFQFLRNNNQAQRVVPGSQPPDSESWAAVPFFLYSFILDFVVMVLTILGLFRHKPARASSLWLRLYRQGVLYFVCMSVVNLPLLILTSLAISPCLTGALAAPSLTATVIASCMAVTSLFDLGNNSESRSSVDENEGSQGSNRLSTIQVSVSMLQQAEQRDSDVIQHNSFKELDPVPEDACKV